LLRPVLPGPDESEQSPVTPVLVKHSITGDLSDAFNAVTTLQEPKTQQRMRLSPTGYVYEHTGPNPHVGLIMRGRETPVTADPAEGLRDDVLAAQKAMLDRFGRVLPLVIDVSHGNGASFSPDNKKSAEGQRRCLAVVAEMLGDPALRISGVMIESNLYEGADTTGNTPGMSRTDPCIGHEEAVDTLQMLSEAFDARQTAVRAAA
jgi:phospho-2-dehydro-3-deoxyheptonate aldolase